MQRPASKPTTDVWRIFLTAFLFTLLSASSVRSAPPSDADAREKLVGSWVLPREEYSAIKKGGGFTFKRDGTFVSYGVFVLKNQRVRIEVTGKWGIQGGILTEELTASSHPELAAKGLVTRDTLLTVTDKEYRTRTERGTVQVYARK